MQTITADKAILEMIRRNLGNMNIAERNEQPWLVDQYQHTINDLAIAYSMSESFDPDYPLTVKQVIEYAQTKQDLFPL